MTKNQPIFSVSTFTGANLLALLLLIAPLTLSAQVGKVSGRVTDASTGDALPGANIVLAQTNLGAAADGEGYFEIKNVPNGEYEIKVSFIGYETYESTLNVFDVDPTTYQNLSIQLAVSAIQLQEYVVTASRGRREKITDAPAAISVILSLIHI